MRTKAMQMLDFEIENCKKDIDYMREQMESGREEGFYAAELKAMQENLAMLREARQAWKYY